ncbi:MAG: response regulator transcription factor [Sulfurimonas sp.]|nr:response regulator transcription factor [Sulfurimonas sp.]
MAGKLILIVDDDEITLEMIGYTLEDEGYKVIKSTNSRDAIELAEKNSLFLNAVLMDLVMPQNDGFMAIRTMKGRRSLRLIPIMALTASNDKESVLKAFNAGADDYLTKPFDPEELLFRVKALCKITDFVRRWQAFAK